MKNYDHIPLKIRTHSASWFNWPQSFLVPEGWMYRYYGDETFRRANHELRVELFASQDWLETVCEEENCRYLDILA